MKIAVDVDAVLFDLVTPLLEFYNKRHGTSFKAHMVKEYNFHKLFGGTLEEEVAMLNEFCATEYFENLKPVPGAIDGIKHLLSKHELVVVTSRNLELKSLTLRQLNEYFPKCFKEVYFTSEHGGVERGKSKKALVVSKIKSDILIEDCFEHAIGMPDGVEVILLDYPWNRKELPKNVHRAKDWKDALRLIAELEKQ